MYVHDLASPEHDGDPVSVALALKVLLDVSPMVKDVAGVLLAVASWFD